MKSATIIALVILYFIVCVGLAIYANKRSKKGTKQDYFVAGGTIGSVILFLTSLATAFSAFAFMGQMGMVYNFGSSAIWNFFTYAIFSYPLFFIVGSKMWYYGNKYGYVTPADFMVHRYESNVPMRLIVGLIICVYFSIFYIVIQIKGCGWALQETTGISTSTAMLVITLLLALYVAIGGMRGVAYADVMQAIILLLGLIVIAGMIILNEGGLAKLFTKALATDPKIFAPKQPTIEIISGGLVMALSMPLWPMLWTKYYSAKNLKAAYSVATGSGLGTVLVTVSLPIIIVCGLKIAYPNWPGSQADVLVIKYALEHTPAVIAAVVVAGLLSAAMSTAGALLLLISSVFSVDMAEILPERMKKKITDKQFVNSGRIFVVAIILISYWISLIPMGQLVKMGIQLAYPGYLLAVPVVYAGLWWKRANKYGAIIGLMLGLIVVYITTFVVKNPLGVASGIWGLITCTVGLIVGSLVTKPTSREVLEQFGLVKDNN
jgi:SSS family solute:Na+ symporter